MINTYIVSVNHGAIASNENMRSIFIEAKSDQEAYELSKSKLIDYGNNEHEYVVGIVEA